MTDAAFTPRAGDAFTAADDLAERWGRARLAALRPLASLDAAGPAAAEESETKCLAAVPPARRDLALRRVFDYSRRLGLSAARWFREEFTAAMIRDVLAASGLPCLAGTWTARGDAHVLERPGCGADAAFLCDYWREAADGLTSGLGTDARYVRHASARHGDGRCVDVLFTDATGRTRLPPVPDAVTAALADVLARLAKMRCVVRLDGCGDGVLYYRLEPAGGNCGAGARIYDELFRREAGARLGPGLRLQDTSPRAVTD